MRADEGQEDLELQPRLFAAVATERTPLRYGLSRCEDMRDRFGV